MVSGNGGRSAQSLPGYHINKQQYIVPVVVTQDGSKYKNNRNGNASQGNSGTNGGNVFNGLNGPYLAPS